jgi:hypothetical protein
MRGQLYTLCTTNKLGIRFEAIKADSVKITIIWDVIQCSLVDKYQRFRETFCIHVQGRRVKIKEAVLPQRRYLSTNLYNLYEV